jgi:3-dehydroquinate synthase
VKRVEVEAANGRYPILIGAGLLGDARHWRELVPGRRGLVVSDSEVAPLYLDALRAALPDRTLEEFRIPAGEAAKTLAQVGGAFAALARLRAGRDDAVLALGGGVVGDLAGFAAACWMRGIAYVQIPTTLLAMVDSAVGGKTAVNLPEGKNLIGAFHQPRLVVADTDTLATLPAREFRSGLAEVVKYGALGDVSFFGWLETNAAALIAQQPGPLLDAIEASCLMKAAIVARDPLEHGERALLNFGHSFGHALEAVSGYGVLRHGEAVAIGMVLAARLSARLGCAPAADAERLARLLHAIGLPTSVPAGTSAAALLDSMHLDKKNLAARLRLILWRGIGHAEVFSDVDERDVAAVLEPPRPV